MRTQLIAAFAANLLILTSSAALAADPAPQFAVRRAAPAATGDERSATSSTYQYDDGTLDFSVNSGSAEICWAHRFSAVAGSDIITSVSAVWTGVPNGRAARVFVWQDPTSDGDPADKVLVASANITVQNSGTNIFNVYTLPVPVRVTGDFYVGVSVTHSPSEFPLPFDSTTPYVARRAFYALTGTPPLNPNTATLTPFENAGIPNYLLLRADASTTNFTYQGRLTNTGTPYTGSGDITATIYDAATAGSVVAPTFAVSNVTFTQGLFSVRVPAAASTFDPGADRWLEISVRTPSGAGAYSVLSPRQRITSAPTAISAATVPWTGITGVPPNIALSPWAAATGGITSASRVGIGVSNPALPLSIAADASDGGLQSWHNQAGARKWNMNLDFYGADFRGLYFSEHSVNAQNLVLREGGNVGISKFPDLTLDVVQGGIIGNSTLVGSQHDPANLGTKVSFGYQVPGTLEFAGMRAGVGSGTNGCGNTADLSFNTWECGTSVSREVMRITGGGRVGIGTGVPLTRLEVNGGTRDGLLVSTDNGLPCALRIRNYTALPAGFETGMYVTNDGFFRISNRISNPSGTYAQLASNGAWSALSDARLKTDVTTAEGNLDAALRLRPVNFRWKSDGSEDFGLIAQEVRGVLPKLVSGDESKDSLTLNYSQLSVVAIGAIQEQQHQIETIRAKQQEIDELKARLAAIEAALARMNTSTTHGTTK